MVLSERERIKLSTEKRGEAINQNFVGKRARRMDTGFAFLSIMILIYV